MCLEESKIFYTIQAFSLGIKDPLDPLFNTELPTSPIFSKHRQDFRISVLSWNKLKVSSKKKSKEKLLFRTKLLNPQILNSKIMKRNLRRCKCGLT